MKFGVGPYTNRMDYFLVCFLQYKIKKLIRVAARSKAWTVFALSNTGILSSNPTPGMDVCVRLICVRAALCAGSGLATGWSPLQGALPAV
jgi:hypothetical protein